jgi:hypothetical protein
MNQFINFDIHLLNEKKCLSFFMILNRNIPVVKQFIIITVLATSVGACVNHDLEASKVFDCTGFKTVEYSNDIQPIIAANCAISGCHNGDNGTDRNWTDPVKLKNHATEVKRRVSLPKTDGDHMPRVGELSDEQMKLIVCWVGQGAPIDN